MTNVVLRKANPAKTRADVVVVGVHSGGKSPQLAAGADDITQAYGRSLGPLLASMSVTGSAGECTVLPTNDIVKAGRIALVGLGEPTDDADELRNRMRSGLGNAARAIKNASTVAIAMPTETAPDLEAATAGYLLGTYAIARTSQSDDDRDQDRVVDLVLVTGNARSQSSQDAVERAQTVTRAICQARDWVNTPPGDLTPPAFADAIVAALKPLPKGRGVTKVQAEVLDETQLAEQGFGGHIAVGQASDAPPRLVRLTYTPKDASKHLAFVGKGITFDSGGLSLKPASGMVTMKCDMAGAAAIVSAITAIAELQLPVRVTAYAAIAENMVSGRSTRPGDVISIYGGTTVEISNTDAEGRLVLADALVRATEDEPDQLVDVATLTGAMVVALGDQVAGVLGDDAVVADLETAAQTAGEPIWHMPITAEVRKRVKSSSIADLAQADGVRWGGGLFAAAFLEQFRGETPWAHLDIAGPAFLSSASGHLPEGGTGFAVATLVELARNAAESE